MLQAEAGGQAIDKIGPVVAVTNSAGGWRALLSALKAKSDNMKGIVAYETPGFVFPEGEGPEPRPDAPYGPNSVPLAEFNKLTRFPIQMVFGDYTDCVRSGPPRSGWHGPSAVSSIVMAAIARSCCSPMRACAATPTSPLPISIMRPLRTNYPSGCTAKAWTSLPENKRWCQRSTSTQLGGNMRLLSLGLFGLVLALAPCHRAVAQEWPNRSVTMIVPFPAGSAVDTCARAVANVLERKLRQTVIVDNRAGAGGNRRGGCRQGVLPTAIRCCSGRRRR